MSDPAAAMPATGEQIHQQTRRALPSPDTPAAELTHTTPAVAEHPTHLYRV
ncbi:hypothetical protein AB0C11_22085 [Streptomyces sp. NPDC039016]|uniref:hypothetical protein n=1 Tax=Streptomyces sp. NPDC039016 TaxID=3154330 RepID=UPI0033F17E12